MKKTIIIAFSLILIIILTSCNTYDYGPTFSFRSAESRLEGEWKLDKALVDDKINPLIFEEEKNYLYKFVEGGTVIKTKTSNGTTLLTLTGTWNFDEDKQFLTLFFEESIISSSNTRTFKILRLTNSSLWMLDSDDRTTKSSKSKVERRFIKL